MIKGFPHYQQLDEMDCGSTSLRMIAKYYGKEYSAEMLRNHCHITRNGVSMLGISEAAEYLGFRTLGVKSLWNSWPTMPPCPASFTGTRTISWSAIR